MTEKEELEKLVKESNSFAEILRRQGKSNSGSATKILKSKLNEYGISCLFLDNKKIFKPLPLEEVLVENRDYSSSRLKKRLILAGLKEDKCEVCGCSNEWNGSFLTLQLDHINGNHSDNRIENLRVICPNCHSQTNTFGTRRMKNVNHCVDCGCIILSLSTRCRSCASKNKKVVRAEYKDIVRPSKEELFELIKTKSFTSIGRTYGVSDSAVKKWCKKYEIPYTKRELRELHKAGLL